MRVSRGVLFVCLLAATMVAREPQTAANGVSFNPAEVFEPQHQARLRKGEAVVVLPDLPRPDVAMVVAVRTDLSAERMIAWSRQAHLMYTSALAPVGGRISNPPRIEDFKTLTLSSGDLQAMRECEPGDCRVKLSRHEMQQLRRAIESAGKNWRPAALEAYRGVLVARATAYLAQGQAGLPPNEDHRRPVTPSAEFAQLLATPQRATVAPLALDEYARRFPVPRDDVESMLFWWKSAASGAREVVTLAHIVVARQPGSNDVVVAEALVYANHYLDASIAYFVLTGTPPDRHLAYFRRTRVDALRGAFGPIVRLILERRVRGEAPAIMSALRHKLEGGDPPSPGLVAPTPVIPEDRRGRHAKSAGNTGDFGWH